MVNKVLARKDAPMACALRPIPPAGQPGGQKDSMAPVSLPKKFGGSKETLGCTAGRKGKAPGRGGHPTCAIILPRVE
jgi:hypothetical protein